MTITLHEKMVTWAYLAKAAAEWEAQIKDEVMRLKQTITAGGARATYTIGRGRYDYEQIAKELGADDDLVYANSKWVTDWRKVGEALGMDGEPDLMEAHFTPGNPGVSLKLHAE